MVNLIINMTWYLNNGGGISGTVIFLYMMLRHADRVFSRSSKVVVSVGVYHDGILMQGTSTRCRLCRNVGLFSRVAIGLVEDVLFLTASGRNKLCYFSVDEETMVNKPNEFGYIYIPPHTCYTSSSVSALTPKKRIR